MIRYTFRDSGPLLIRNAKTADPQVIGEELDKIAAKNGGRLTPAATIAVARAPRHKLHPHFTWDDEKAAIAHRLNEARGLIRSIRLIDDDDDIMKKKIAWLSVAETPHGFAYLTNTAVAANRSLQDLVLRQAEKDLAAWERRYAELHDLCEEIRRIRTALAARRARALDERGGGEAHP